MCRHGRAALGWSQRTLAAKVGVSRATIAAIELGRLDPTLDRTAAIAAALGYELELAFLAPKVIGDGRQRDLVHAVCSGFIDRRLGRASWEVDGEVYFEDGDWRGWIDILAFDPRTGTLLVIEIKTRIDDAGAIERQIGWYARVARRLARDRGWAVRRVECWLIALCTDEVEQAITINRDVLARAFPRRAEDLVATIDGTPPASGGLTRGLAVIDPRRRRRDWILRTKLDGRRSAAPYRNYADAAARVAGGGQGVSETDRSRTNTKATTGVRPESRLSLARSSQKGQSR